MIENVVRNLLVPVTIDLGEKEIPAAKVQNDRGVVRRPTGEELMRVMTDPLFRLVLRSGYGAHA